MPWISKKAKAQIRARRKKKEKHGTKEETVEVKDDGNKLVNHSKRKRNENSNAHEQEHQEGHGQDLNTSTKNWKSIQKDTTTTVTIPSTLTSKEAKKLRKDARRKSRKEGRDENLIKFVDENGKPIIVTTDTTSKTSDKDDNNNESEDAGSTKDSHNIDENEEKDAQTKKRRKLNKKPKLFPNINQILADAAEAQKKIIEKQKRQSYEDSLPPEIKAQYVALDCEMVGIGAEGRQSALARVSITDWYGEVILDTFVQVPDRVTDFRTFVSGVRPKDINTTSSNSMELHACRKKVGEIIKRKVLVGHALKNDFAALMMGHPKHMIRDTAKYKPFMRASGKNGGKLRPRKLRDLVKENVGMVIQKEGEAHTSVEDAQATMELYKCVREQWEKEIEKAELVKTKKKKR